MQLIAGSLPLACVFQTLEPSTMVPRYISLAALFLAIAYTSGVEVNNVNQLAAAKNGQSITIKNLRVPAGQTLDLTNLKPGTLLEFDGKITFDYAEWAGPLVKIGGKNLQIVGKPGHLFDGEGARWWDGKGSRPGGKKKPRFMEIIVDDSTVTGLNIKNPPAWCLVANWCHNLVISNVNIDVGDGDKLGAFETDGFGVGYGSNVTILNSKVRNQDDCFVTGAGKDILVDNLECVGGHGISIGSLGRGAVVENVLIKNSRIIKNMVGIRIKSGVNEVGAIRNVTYDNIELKDITRYGIIVHGNYGSSGGPEGEPTPFPIENIVLNNVRGSVHRKGTNVWINVAEGANNWKWENINVTGGKREVSCKGVPAGLNGIRCGKK